MMHSPNPKLFSLLKASVGVKHASLLLSLLLLSVILSTSEALVTPQSLKSKVQPSGRPSFSLSAYLRIFEDDMREQDCDAWIPEARKGFVYDGLHLRPALLHVESSSESTRNKVNILPDLLRYKDNVAHLTSNPGSALLCSRNLRCSHTIRAFRFGYTSCHEPHNMRFYPYVKTLQSNEQLPHSSTYTVCCHHSTPPYQQDHGYPRLFHGNRGYSFAFLAAHRALHCSQPSTFSNIFIAARSLGNSKQNISRGIDTYPNASYDNIILLLRQQVVRIQGSSALSAVKFPTPPRSIYPPAAPLDYEAVLRGFPAYIVNYTTTLREKLDEDTFFGMDSMFGRIWDKKVLLQQLAYFIHEDKFNVVRSILRENPLILRDDEAQFLIKNVIYLLKLKFLKKVKNIGPVPPKLLISDWKKLFFKQKGSFYENAPGDESKQIGGQESNSVVVPGEEFDKKQGDNASPSNGKILKDGHGKVIGMNQHQASDDFTVNDTLEELIKDEAEGLSECGTASDIQEKISANVKEDAVGVRKRKKSNSQLLRKLKGLTDQTQLKISMAQKLLPPMLPGGVGATRDGVTGWAKLQVLTKTITLEEGRLAHARMQIDRRMNSLLRGLKSHGLFRPPNRKVNRNKYKAKTNIDAISSDLLEPKVYDLERKKEVNEKFSEAVWNEDLPKACLYLRKETRLIDLKKNRPVLKKLLDLFDIVHKSGKYDEKQLKFIRKVWWSTIYKPRVIIKLAEIMGDMGPDALRVQYEQQLEAHRKARDKKNFEYWKKKGVDLNEFSDDFSDAKGYDWLLDMIEETMQKREAPFNVASQSQNGDGGDAIVPSVKEANSPNNSSPVTLDDTDEPSSP